MIAKELKIFLTAVRFFTRIPVPRSIGYSEEMLNKSMRYFPLMGWIIGGISALVYFGTNYIFPSEIRILLSIAATILMTGAFHEDGFADVCDGFGGGWDKEQILKIMKDSRLGSYGVIGVFMILIIKFFILFKLKPLFIPLGMIAAHSISRFASASFIYTDKYVGDTDSSISKPIGNSISLKELLIAAFFGLFPAIWIIIWFLTAKGIHQLPNPMHMIYISSIFLVILLIPAFFSKWLLARFFRNNIGGYTGDCLGAIQQLTEVVFYLSLYMLVNNQDIIFDSFVK